MLGWGGGDEVVRGEAERVCEPLIVVGNSKSMSTLTEILASIEVKPR